jgi:hypothetical protein
MAAELGATTSRVLNSLAYAMANKASDVALVATADLIPIYDASAEAMKYATPAELRQANTSVVAAGGAAVTALVGGGTYLIPLVTANATITLPAATLGQQHRFVFIGSAADAEDWVITSPTLFVGGFGHADVGGTTAAVYANGSSHLVATINNPAAGTDITFIGDGTNWACTGTVFSADAPAFS